MQAAAPTKKTRNWYSDYLRHPFAQYKMTFIEYKRLRSEGKI
jgi:hypothetical protein